MRFNIERESLVEDDTENLTIELSKLKFFLTQNTLIDIALHWNVVFWMATTIIYFTWLARST